jgi:hypothetical protein
LSFSAQSTRVNNSGKKIGSIPEDQRAINSRLKDPGEEVSYQKID